MNDSANKVLLIEDDPANVEMLKYLLGNYGFEVFVAMDGITGIEQALANPPDLILLDIMMIGIDGFETCRRLKADATTRDIPVIFLSARADVVDKVKGLNIGAVDYITKPFQYEEVIARVRNHILINQQRIEIERLRDEDRKYYEKLSAMKDEVMSTASHDLKSPLSVILTSLNLIRDYGKINDEHGRQLLEAVETSARQMRTLIVDVLDLARIETGHGLLLENISVNAYLKTVFDSTLPLAQTKQIALRFCPAETDCQVEIDTVRMNQVMNNLFSNAINYTPQWGEVKLIIDVRRRIVLIQVQDNGLGISEEDLPHVFDKFYRARSKEHLGQDGTGLGLAIAKSIVEQHKGEIWVENNPAEGTTVNIALPIKDP